MGFGFIEIILTLCIVIIISPRLGKYIANIFLQEKTVLDPILTPIEKIIYALIGVSKHTEMTGWQYLRALLSTNLVMGITAYSILYFQTSLPWNPNRLGSNNWDLVLHTTISFLTNTDQQHYNPESTFSYFSQTTALGFLMFTSAATGLVAAMAFIRGLSGRKLGNFYVDFTRSITRILLPISIIGAIALVILGVPQTLQGTLLVETLEGRSQYLARGPVASWEMIKMLGENGGGFFTANSAHPYENPNPASNLLEVIAMLAIPSSLIHTYGIFINNRKQTWLLFNMVLIIFVALISMASIAELQGNPLVNNILEVQVPNLEGKELRFGWAETALWSVTTTSTMTGAVNGSQDSLMPQSIFTSLFSLFLQIIWGGQGTGTAYLLIYLILTIFITGLMVGRTPEIFGRKIEKREIVLASLILLIHPMMVLIPTALTLAYPISLSGISNPGFHGISQVVYEYASAAANNGSGLEGLNDHTLWWNLTTSLSILLGRYITIICLILLADSMSKKLVSPENRGTLKTDSLVFTTITAGITIILGVLTFFPVLALGPIAESFKLGG